jgi:protoporphyrinogen oxidase
MQSTEKYQYVIVGPAGLQMAYYLKKAGRSYVVLEGKEKPGAFFDIFPRHRKLISINKVYTGYLDNEINLRWDWNSLLEEDDTEPLLFKQFSRQYFPAAEEC